MSDKSRPISFSVYGQLAAAEQAHVNAVQATVSGIADETALHQWASCKAAAIRTSGSANADELRFILDVVDRAAVLRLSTDAAAALSWRCRTAAQNALAGPGAEDVRMLRACLAALDSVTDTPPPSTSTPPTGTQTDEGEKPRSSKQCSTGRGDSRLKLISALTKHHQYAEGGCLNLEPIGNNELAKAAGVSPSTASAFFNDKFLGHTNYKALCRDAGKITAALKLLNDEFAPYHLLGAASSDLAAPEQDDADSD